MKTVYIAPHRTYVLAADGSLLAMADKAPTELPQTVDTHSHGSLHQVHANRRQLCGPWLVFLQRLASAMASPCRMPSGALRSYGDTLWSGEGFRLVSWLQRGMRNDERTHFFRRFDAVVSL